MVGRALGILLAVAVAALLAAADDDDDDKSPWKCFRSCARGCYHHHDNNVSATVADFPPSEDGNVSAVTGECENGCHDDECYKDLPAISHTQCAIATCLSHPHHSKNKTACLKDCCDKCFGKSPPKPGPPKPSPPEPPNPPAPGPSEPPGPGPEPPSPPN